MTAKPILISGCPRSGTTFCGNIISKSPEVFEVYEPFNQEFTYNFGLPAQFFKITRENERQFKPFVDRVLALKDLSNRVSRLPRGAIDRVRSTRDVASALALKKLVRDHDSFFHSSRISLKDPIAFFSADWFADTYDADVVMMCRHPGGVVSSFLNLRWEPETQYIVDHSLPLSDGKFDKEIAAWRAAPDDVVGALILQWKIFTQTTLDWQKMYPHWFYCLHDQLCDHPLEVFEAIFEHVGLPFSDQISARILDDTCAKNIIDPKKHSQHNLKRQSCELKHQWRKRLDADVAMRIERETEALWEEAQNAFSLTI